MLDAAKFVRRRSYAKVKLVIEKTAACQIHFMPLSIRNNRRASAIKEIGEGAKNHRHSDINCVPTFKVEP
jgi:hypothetical protein